MAGNSINLRWPRIIQAILLLSLAYYLLLHLSWPSLPQFTTEFGVNNLNPANTQSNLLPPPNNDVPKQQLAFDPNAAFHREQRYCQKDLSSVFDRFQVIVKTGAVEEKDRLPGHINSVCKCIHNLLIFSDMASKIEGITIHDALAYLPNDQMNTTDNSDWAYYEDQKSHIRNQRYGDLNPQQGWKLDRFKFLPMVYASFKMRPNAAWYIFIETDTYVFWDGLLRLLGTFDADDEFYIGSPINSQIPGDESFYAYGGSGFVLSQGAMRTLFNSTEESESTDSQEEQQQEEVDTYPFSTRPDWLSSMKEMVYGETILGSALKEAGITLTGLYPHFFPFNYETISFGKGRSAVWCQPVVTMHKIFYRHEYINLQPWAFHNRVPLLFSDIFNFLQPHVTAQKFETDTAGFKPPFEKSDDRSLGECKEGCARNSRCMQYTHHEGRCRLFDSVSRGNYRFVEPEKSSGIGSKLDLEMSVETGRNYTTGWMTRRIESGILAEKNRCYYPEWLDASVERHWLGGIDD